MRYINKCHKCNKPTIHDYNGCTVCEGNRKAFAKALNDIGKKEDFYKLDYYKLYEIVKIIKRK